MTSLFEPMTMRGVTVRNRIWLSPMCQYSSENGMPNDWHLVHLGARASGGVGLVMTEAAAVTPVGRISPGDAGMWSDDQAQAWARITAFIASQGASSAIQLAHAGRKASIKRPWDGSGYADSAAGGWSTVAPSAHAFGPLPVPKEMDAHEIAELVASFASAARRSTDAGFDLIEIHAAHGYLLHEFLSPLSNLRSDEFGGTFENRIRVLVQVVDAVRHAIPERNALLVRISATDYVEGGWDLEQSVELSRVLRERGVDLMDVSSGGLDPRQSLTPEPNYQVPFAERIRREAGIPTGAVGLITEPKQAQEILDQGQADAIFLGRVLLREPSWALRAAAELGGDGAYPVQYDRGRY